MEVPVVTFLRRTFFIHYCKLKVKNNGFVNLTTHFDWLNMCSNSQ